MPDHLYQQKLHDQFLQQLVDDWEVHFARHGESGANLSGVQNVNGFVEAVADVVERELAAQVGRKEAVRLTPSKDTFRRLLFEYDINNRWQTKTKQALCLFLGFASWEAFKTSVRAEVEREPVSITINQLTVRPGWLPIRQVMPLLPYATEVVEQAKPKPLPWRAGIAGLILLTALAGLSQWAWHWWQNRPFTAEQVKGVRFRILRVEGSSLPQTLVFAYDVSSLDVDSVVVGFGSIGNEYNQQPGDLDRMVFHQANGQFTYPFWKPAFCLIRLIARNQVVAMLRHTTRTDGWIGWTADPVNGNTQALSQVEIRADGRLKLPITARKGQPGDFSSLLMHQKLFGLDADEMDWQVRLKNPFSEGGISCFDPSISLQWGGSESQKIAMQTTRLGCGVGVFIRFGEQLLRNGDHNLSQLSTDFESWRTLRIVTQNRVATFYIDGQLVFRHPYREDLGAIQALAVGFKGFGSVDWVRLANSRTGQVVYEDGF